MVDRVLCLRVGLFYRTGICSVWVLMTVAAISTEKHRNSSDLRS